MFEKEDINYYATPSAQYYEKIIQNLDDVVSKIDEITRGQQDIKEMLSSIISMGSTPKPERAIEDINEKVPVSNNVAHHTKAKYHYKRGALNKAVQFILDFVADGECLMSDMDKAAMSAGLSQNSYNKAKTYLYNEEKIVRRMTGTHKDHKSFVRLAGTEPVEEPKPVKPQQSIEEIMGIATEDYQGYCTKANYLAALVLFQSPEGKYKTCASVYKDVWEKMTAQYGFCWSQMGKDAKRKYGLERAPHRLALCYQDENAKSIFIAKLEDMAYNLQAEKDKANTAA